MAKIIGIDLGTSNSAAAAMIGGKPTIIPSAEGTSIGGKAFPSYVAFTKDGQKLVGAGKTSGGFQHGRYRNRHQKKDGFGL